MRPGAGQSNRFRWDVASSSAWWRKSGCEDSDAKVLRVRGSFMYVAYIMSCNPEVQLVDKDWTEGSLRCMVLNIQFSHATASAARKDSIRPRVTWNSTPEDGSAAPRRRAVNQTHLTQQSDFFFAPLIHSKHDSQMRGQLCRSIVVEPSKNRAVVLLLSYNMSWLGMILNAPPCQATLLTSACGRVRAISKPST